MEGQEPDLDPGQERRRRSQRRHRDRSKRLRKNKQLQNALYNLRWIGIILLVGLPVMGGMFYLLHNL